MAAETVLSSGFTCHCGCHDSGFETCPYCERHPELHVSAPVNVGEQSNSPAPRKEAGQPTVASRPNPLRTSFAAVVIVLTSIIFLLGFYLHGIGAVNDVYVGTNESNMVPFSEASVLDQGAIAISWLVISMTLAITAVGATILIGMSLYITFWPLGLLSAFLLKPLKPILLPVAYPFIGVWAAGRWVVCLLIQLLRFMAIVPTLVLKSFFGLTFMRRYSDSYIVHKENCSCNKCVTLGGAVAAWSIMMILAFMLSAFSVFVFSPVNALGIASLVFLSTNILSIFYELGRQYHNKPVPQVVQEKPNPIV